MHDVITPGARSEDQFVAPSSARHGQECRQPETDGDGQALGLSIGQSGFDPSLDDERELGAPGGFRAEEQEARAFNAAPDLLKAQVHGKHVMANGGVADAQVRIRQGATEPLEGLH